MHVRVYVTDDGTQSGTLPIAFVNGWQPVAMPRHPQSLRWQYWCTIDDQDRMLNAEDNLARRSVQLQGFYISHKEARQTGPGSSRAERECHP